jgi:hypothetical protein
MSLNEKKIREIVRKNLIMHLLINEQVDGEADDVDNDGVPDAIDRDVVAENKPLEEDTAATAALKKELLSQAKLLEKGCRTGVGLSKGMTRKKARDLADKLYEATEGAGDGAITGAVAYATMGLVSGLGTNEVAVQEVFSDPAIKCLADLSYVAYMYEKNYPGYTLASTLAGEYGYFSSTEFRKNVRDPLEDLLSDNPIFILGDTKFDAEKIAQMKRDAEQFTSDSQELVGRDGTERALDAGKGVAAAAGVLGAIGAAGNVAGTISVTGLTGGGLLSAMGSGFIGGATVGTVGTAGAAVGTAAVTGTAAGTGAFLPVVGSALAAIPGPGWAVLGVLAVGSALFMAFDEADFTAQEESMLSPDLYIGLNDTFKESSEALRSEAEKAFIPLPAQEEEEEIDPIDGDPDVLYPVLPPDIDSLGGSTSDLIRKIQFVMNKYSESRNLSASKIAVDGKWGNETQEMWRSVFVKDVFKNHPVFSEMSFAGEAQSGSMYIWKDLSANMISSYPGYTPGQRGCLAFCLDAYYGNNRYGKINMGDELQGGSGGGGGNKKVVISPEDKDKNKDKKGGESQKRASSSGSSWRDIDIDVRFNKNNVRALNLDDTKTTRLENASSLKSVSNSLWMTMSQDLVANMRRSKGFFSGKRGDMVQNEQTFTVKISIKRNGAIKIKKTKGTPIFQGSGTFESMNRIINQTLTNASNKDLIKAFDDCELTVRIPPGRYADQPREDIISKDSDILSEQKIKRLIKNAIIKAYLNS